ncbi:MAG: hypothetical protein IJ046_03790 [Clostridia bacterium]|nr:hypothetical protein [Clostridia bacterium]
MADSSLESKGAMVLSGGAIILQLLLAAAIPALAVSLVKSEGRGIFGLLLFAAGFEIFYDFFVFGKPDFSEQSPALSAFFASCTVYLLCAKERRGISGAIVFVAAVAAAVVWVTVLSCAFGAATVLFTAVVLATRKRPKVMPFAGALLLGAFSVFSPYYMLAPLGSAVVFKEAVRERDGR